MNVDVMLKLSKLMLTQLISLVFLSNCLSQNSLNFRLLDSVSIQTESLFNEEGINNGYRIKIIDSVVFCLTNNNNFYIVNLYTGEMSKGTLHLDSRKNSFSIYDFTVNESYITTINFNGDEIRVFDESGTQVKRIKLKTFFSKFHVKPYSNVLYNESNGYFFLPIATKFREEFILNKIKKANQYYRRMGLIGVFDQKGRLIQKVGSYDSIYQNNFYTHSDNYYFDLLGENHIILSQELSGKIDVFKMNGDLSRSSNLKAKHIISDIHSVPISESVEKEDVNRYKIESFSYGKLAIANQSGLCYRYYKVSKKDTTRSDDTQNLLENETKAVCKAPTIRELNQKMIIKNKNIYVQIFQIETGRVYYDGVFPFKGEFIYSGKNTKEGYVWTGKLTTKEIKLYRYKILR